MTLKPPTPPKKRVTLMVWISLIIDIVADLLKILLFFGQALGAATGLITLGIGAALGVAIDFTMSILLSFIEILVMASNFFGSGLYKPGKGSMMNLLMFWSVSALGFVPEVDDLPLASGTTIVAIFNAKRAEREDHRHYQVELKKYNDAVAAKRAQQLLAAQRAAENAASVPENIRLAA